MPSDLQPPAVADAETATGARVLALLPPSGRATQVREAAVAATKPSGWLTLAVPTLLSRAESFALLGSVAPTYAELERSARAHLDKHLEVLADRGRVCGTILEIPVLNSLLRRIAAADHDLIVVPAGFCELGLFVALRAMTKARVVRASACRAA